MKFNPGEDIPDLSGKVIIVTGGTDGLGKQSILELSKHNPSKIYLAARSPSKAESTISHLRSLESSCPIEFLPLDLSSFASIHSAAKTFLSKETRLDILLANAGQIGTKGVTEEGIEMTMGVNHVGHALFIRLLLPTMSTTAKLNGTAKGDTRVVVVGSEAEAYAGKKYPFDTLHSPQDNLWSFTKYANSKLANLHYVRQLVAHYPEAEHGVRFICIHPGNVRTNIGGDFLGTWPRAQKALKKIVFAAMRALDVEDGARNQLWACAGKSTGAVVEPLNGEFYWPVALTGKGSKLSDDVDMASGLWEWTEAILAPELQGVH